MPGEFAKIKNAFFTSEKVVRFMDKKTRKVLSKFGAYVRRQAQTSMKTPGKKAYKAAAERAAAKGKRSNQFPASRPGNPPFAHGRRLLRKLLFFAYDTATRTVVIGPVRLGETANQHVPKTLEFGGIIHRKSFFTGKRHADKYKERPFMRPAFKANLGWVAEEYRKSV